MTLALALGKSDKEHKYMQGFFSAVSGAAAQEIWLEKVSNNLANVNTVDTRGTTQHLKRCS